MLLKEEKGETNFRAMNFGMLSFYTIHSLNHFYGFSRGSFDKWKDCAYMLYLSRIFFMSNLFIQNELLRNKIQKMVFSDKIPQKMPNDETIEEDDFDTDNDYITPPSENVQDTTKENSIDNLDETELVYHYLDDDNGVLQKDFGLSVSNGLLDINTTYSVHLCGYRQNNTLDNLPFVQYFMIYNRPFFHFPQFSFQCGNNIQTDEDDDHQEQSPEQIYFVNQCMEHLLNYIEPLPAETNAFQTAYKGFVQRNVQEKTTLYVFFDLEHFSEILEERKYIWATLDEIVNKHKISSLDVQPECYNVFYQHPDLFQMKNRKGDVLQDPTVLFLCSKANNQYENLYNTTDEFSIVDPSIDHPIFGQFYYFTVDPIYSTQDLFYIRRFACFFIQPTYLLKPIPALEQSNPSLMNRFVDTIQSFQTQTKSVSSEISKKEEPVTSTPSTIMKITQKTIQSMMGPLYPSHKPSNSSLLEEKQTRSIQGGLDENAQDSILSSEKENVPITEIQDDIDMNEDEDAEQIQERELIELQNIDTGCIYFHEYVGDRSVPFWCIKSTSHFTEL